MYIYFHFYVVRVNKHFYKTEFYIHYLFHLVSYYSQMILLPTKKEVKFYSTLYSSAQDFQYPVLFQDSFAQTFVNTLTSFLGDFLIDMLKFAIIYLNMVSLIVRD